MAKAKGSKKKTGSAGRKASGKAAAKSKGTVREKAQEEALDAAENPQQGKGLVMGDEVAILATFLISLLLFLSNLGLCGFIGQILRSAQLGLFGGLGFFFPFLLIGAVLFLLSHAEDPGASRKMTAAFFILVFLTALVHLLFAGVEGKTLLEFYQEAGAGMINGGVIGGALAMLLHSFCGQVGSFLILLALIMLCVVFITEKPLMKMFAMGSLHAAGKAKDRAREDLRELSKTARSHKEERQKKQQEERASASLGVDFSAINLSIPRPAGTLAGDGIDADADREMAAALTEGEDAAEDAGGKAGLEPAVFDRGGNFAALSAALSAASAHAKEAYHGTGKSRPEEADAFHGEDGGEEDIREAVAISEPRRGLSRLSPERNPQTGGVRAPRPRPLADYGDGGYDDALSYAEDGEELYFDEEEDSDRLENLVGEVDLPLNTRHRDATLTEEEFAYRMSVLHGGEGRVPKRKTRRDRRNRRRHPADTLSAPEAAQQQPAAPELYVPAQENPDQEIDEIETLDVLMPEKGAEAMPQDGMEDIPQEEAPSNMQEEALPGARDDAASMPQDERQEEDAKPVLEGSYGGMHVKYLGDAEPDTEDDGRLLGNQEEEQNTLAYKEQNAHAAEDEGSSYGTAADSYDLGIGNKDIDENAVEENAPDEDSMGENAVDENVSSDQASHISALAQRLGLGSAGNGKAASAGQIDRLLGYESSGSGEGSGDGAAEPELYEEGTGVKESDESEKDAYESADGGYEDGNDAYGGEEEEGGDVVKESGMDDGEGDIDIAADSLPGLPAEEAAGHGREAGLSGRTSSSQGHRVILTASGQRIQADVEPVDKLTERERAEAARYAAEERALAEAKLQQEMREEKKKRKAYQFPPLSLLARGGLQSADTREEIQENASILQQTLKSFGIGVTVTNVSVGPSVTRYELMPEQGIKLSKIVALTNDIKMRLAAADIRMEAPIPGKSAVGIEVPNKKSQTVFLGDIFGSEEFQKSQGRITFGVGKDIAGKTVVTDIAKMPHLLIAGATGAGKSVSINTLIMSILYKYGPEDVRLIMVDPKVVELQVYNGIPHLLIPVVTDPKKAAAALNWAVQEMTERYKKFAETGSRDLKGYNEKVDAVRRDDAVPEEEKPERLPQIVIIIDELADLMMVSAQEVEDAICRIAQLARACGMHLVIATQRPSVNVITGLIKANIPSRIAFAVSSGTDSRTILDMVGAEKLLGKGDMLFYPSGIPKPIRVQGAFVSDEEVQAVTDFLRETGEPDYNDAVKSSMDGPADAAREEEGGSAYDQLFREAAMTIISTEKASIGMLQRKFRIGFNRAARIMDQLAEAGVVGPEEGTKPRKILMSMEEFQQAFPEG